MSGLVGRMAPRVKKARRKKERGASAARFGNEEEQKPRQLGPPPKLPQDSEQQQDLGKLHEKFSGGGHQCSSFFQITPARPIMRSEADGRACRLRLRL